MEDGRPLASLARKTDAMKHLSDILSRHSPGYGAQDLIGYGSYVSGYLVSSNSIIAAHAHQDSLLARRNIRRISDIRQEPIHADAPDDRAALPTEKDCTPVG